MKIPRVQNITEDQFITEYLLPGKPVIVIDAMRNWDLGKFNPEFLQEKFGEYDVQVYNDLFELQTIESLSAYLERNFGVEKEGEECEYIRWYTQFKDIDFFWADEVFYALKPYWEHPCFFPGNSLILPFCEAENQKKVNEAAFPYKGLFISGKGSKTRLHKDPLNSNALLCQLYGEKKIVLFDPSKEDMLMQGEEFVDLNNIDQVKFPHASGLKPDFEDILKPGEIVLFPAGWFHDVNSISDSVSITWNFVHSLEWKAFQQYIINHPEDKHIEVIRYFLKDKISKGATIDEVLAFYQNQFSQNNEVVNL